MNQTQKYRKYMSSESRTHGVGQTETEPEPLEVESTPLARAGAKATDLPHLKEGEEGSGAQYVTLVSFRGNGRVIEAYLLPEPERGPQAQAAD